MSIDSFRDSNQRVNGEIDSVSVTLPENFEGMKSLLIKMNRIYESFASLHRQTINMLSAPVEIQEAFDSTKNKLMEKFDVVNGIWKQYKKDRTWSQASKDIWSESKIKKTFKKNKEKLNTVEYGVDPIQVRRQWYERILLPLTTLMEVSQIGANAAFIGYVCTH